MRRIIYLFIALVIITSNVLAQQIPLRGVVTVQNSKTYTGNTQYVKNAEATHPNAKTEVTDDDGKFTLYITGLKENSQTQITVIPYGEYTDYVVVNERELQDITLNRVLPISVYICKKGELEQRTADMIGINMRKIEERMENDKNRLQKELEELKLKNDYLNVRFKEIKDSLQFISDNIDNIFERIKKYAKTLVIENIDDKAENYANAYSCFLRGELDSVSYYLIDEELDLKYQKILLIQQESKKERESAAILIESAKEKEEYTENNFNELLKEWLLLANTADLQNDYEKAMFYYEKVISADTMNLDIILSYADYLRNINMNIKAEKFYLKCLSICEFLVKKNSSLYLQYLVIALNKLGDNYFAQHKYNTAEKYYLRCLDIREQQSKENPNVYLSDLADILNDLGDNYYNQKKFSTAEKYYLRCMDIREQKVKENSEYITDLKIILKHISLNYAAQGKEKKALKYYMRCLNYIEKLAKSNQKDYLPLLATILNEIGSYYQFFLYDSKKATKYYLRCLEIIGTFRKPVDYA